MKKQPLFLLLALLLRLTGHAQAPTATDFAAFAEDNHARMIKACEQHDIPGYRHLLDTFMVRWNTLDSTAQKSHAGYRIDAYYNLACIYALVNQPKPALGLSRKINSGRLYQLHPYHS